MGWFSGHQCTGDRKSVRSGEFLTDSLSREVYVSKRRNFFRDALAWGTGTMAALRLNSAAGPLPPAQTSDIPGYQNAKLVADRYGGNPAVCATSLRAFRLEADYIVVRENLKANALMLNSFLLSGGLDTPSTMETMEMPATLH